MLVQTMEANMNIISTIDHQDAAEIFLQQITSQVANVEKGMVILEKNEFSSFKAGSEKIKTGISCVKRTSNG